MILHVPNVLNEQQVAHCRDVIEHATCGRSCHRWLPVCQCQG